MQVIPLNPVPNQTLKIILSNQLCQINIYEKFFGLFVDLYVNGNLIIGGVIAHNLNVIVRSKYLGFIGDLFFLDNVGADDPDYTGLGDQFSLVYVDETDLAQIIL